MIKRRNLLKSASALAALPFIASTARASTPVSLTDPAVVALKYVEDATDATRVDKMGFKGNAQICSNCRFYAKTDAVWGGCALFQNKLVKGEGWCNGWVPLAN
ncbi:high-potential iron-sulfur protein [Pseudomonadales bacterium]|jgi:hypothetical protein|nr:hypothetical protein [Gammaproteobacteria bacterium]MDA7772632.1 high-potential iron-sulfur protein [Pseudomonadales bacterium]MBT3709180.1 hypothetical protein [Gammaproteobacteria bacterium]MBT3733933.1 hypothetical protein [Gammaproteobacteria bacterium]MBT7540548.1 hypothetical protein [Gammaproteobacteria bacterium]|tara:strand:+ start:164 stop:472 length:309 start_codon:yes stop_codon:yes gene_type:complete